MIERRLIDRFAETLGEHCGVSEIIVDSDSNYAVCACGVPLIHSSSYPEVLQLAYETHVAEELLESVRHLLPWVDNDE